MSTGICGKEEKSLNVLTRPYINLLQTQAYPPQNTTHRSNNDQCQDSCARFIGYRYRSIIASGNATSRASIRISFRSATRFFCDWGFRATNNVQDLQPYSCSRFCTLPKAQHVCTRPKSIVGKRTLKCTARPLPATRQASVCNPTLPTSNKLLLVASLIVLVIKPLKVNTSGAVTWHTSKPKAHESMSTLPSREEISSFRRQAAGVLIQCIERMTIKTQTLRLPQTTSNPHTVSFELFL